MTRRQFLASILLFISSTAFGATPRIGLAQPANGTANWGVILNSNFGTIDSSAAIQNQPNTYSSSNTFNAPIAVSTINGNGGGVTISSNAVIIGSATIQGAGGLGVTYGISAGSATASNISLFQPAGTVNRVQVLSPSSSVNLRLDADQGNGAAFVGTVSNHPLTFLANGSGAMTVATGGNVGVGTASPATKLHMSSGTLTVDGTNPLIQSATHAPQNGITGFLTDIQYVAMDSAGNNAGTFSADANGTYITGTALGAGPYKPVSIKTGGSTRILVDTSGNMGVGTTNPATTLDVNGPTQFGSGATKSTFTATGALNLNSGSALTLAGAAGVVTSQSSMTASAFFGAASGLTDISRSSATALASLSTNQTTFIVALATVTITTRGNPVEISFTGGGSPGLSTSRCVLSYLLDGGYDSGFSAFGGVLDVDYGQSGRQNWSWSWVTRPAAGAHSFALTVYNNTGATCTVTSSTGNSQFRVKELP